MIWAKLNEFDQRTVRDFLLNEPSCSETAVSLASKLGLRRATTRRALDDLVNGVFGWQVQDDLKEGINRGVKELPAFFINDEPFTGKPTFANLSAAIDQALKKSKKKPLAKQRA